MNDLHHCIFCRIIKGDLHAEIVYQDERVTAFWDIHPIAPVHILVVPNQHIESVNTVSQEDDSILGHLIITAGQIAKSQGVENSGYRLVINTGPDAGQSIFHLHLHLIGGRHLSFRSQ